MPYISNNVENLIALIDNESTATNSSIKDLKRKNFITDNISLIKFLTEGLVYLRKYNINITVIIKSLTEKKPSYCSSIFAKWKSNQRI